MLTMTLEAFNKKFNLNNTAIWTAERKALESYLDKHPVPVLHLTQDQADALSEFNYYQEEVGYQTELINVNAYYLVLISQEEMVDKLIDAWYAWGGMSGLLTGANEECQRIETLLKVYCSEEELSERLKEQ